MAKLHILTAWIYTKFVAPASDLKSTVLSQVDQLA